MTIKNISLWPKTLSRQFMAVLVLVLCLAQAINFLLLVDERRIVSEASIQTLMIEKIVNDISSLDLSAPIDLDFEFGPNLEITGGFFLSTSSFADKAPGTIPKPRLERRLRAKLLREDVNPEVLIITLQEDGYLPNDDTFPQPASGEGPLNTQPMGSPMGGQFGPPMGGQFGPPMGEGLEAPLGAPMGPEGFGPMGQRNLPSGSNAPSGTLPAEQDRLQELIVSVELQPNIWYNALVPHTPVKAITLRIFLATAILMFLTLLVARFFVKKISEPLEAFSNAATRFGRGESSVILDESGPQDIREAAIAFNIMQRRLSRMIDSQRSMLQAVGHDLRTPLTAMRLRAENIKDEPNRDALVKSIDDMTVMTKEILSWAKDVSAGEDMAKVNLTSLIQSVCDNYLDQGLPVTFEHEAPLIVSVRRVSLKRALGNLIDNALKYGLTAKVSTRQDPGFICIIIDDEGPGIPETQLENALKPFVRLEESRSKETGGTGLGLSLAESIIQAQGGKLTLENRSNKGLRATVFIPV